MIQKKMKYTINDRAFMDRILNAFCNKHTKKTWILTGQTGEIDLGKSSIPKKAVEFFEKEGMNPRFDTVARYTGKRKIGNLSVEVRAKCPTNYAADGVIITIVCSGETEKDCQHDLEEKELTLVKYATSRGIPVKRICAESAVGCVYKFADAENQACAV
jgi:hypothetical protein